MLNLFAPDAAKFLFFQAQLAGRLFAQLEGLCGACRFELADGSPIHFGVGAELRAGIADHAPDDEDEGRIHFLFLVWGDVLRPQLPHLSPA